jgi:hypothetical protein
MKTRTKRSVEAAAAAVADEQIEYVSFAEAVKRAKAAIVGHQKSESAMQWIVGEMAYRLRPIYGDKTTERFANAIGLTRGLANRYKLTYRLWHNSPVKDAVSFFTLMALNRHPDREKIAKSKPSLVKARQIAQAHGRSKHRAGSGRPRTISQYASDAIRHANKFLDPDGVFRHSVEMLRKGQGNMTDNMRRDLSAMANRGVKAFEEVLDVCKVIRFGRRGTRQAKRAS